MPKQIREKITCGRCQMVLTYDPSKLPKGKVKGTCKRCGEKITINNIATKPQRETSLSRPKSTTQACPSCNFTNDINL